MSQPLRPAFEPTVCRERSNIALNGLNNSDWRAIVQCKAHFPLHLFEPVMKNLIHHPELTIALILRAEIISKDDQLPWEDLVHNAMDQEEQIKGFIPCETVHRKLVPKVPERDAPLRQDCILYRAEDGMDIQLVVFIPKMDPKQRMPHYHPDVKAIAFQYIPSTSDETSILRIDIPLDDPSAALPTSRLFKTCLVLLDTISKHGWGLFNGYKKRVVHDTVVQKETYQDLYYIMKEKYKYLKDEWIESTDATKNVFEDIGIATFLMLLWKDTYHSKDAAESEVWGRPPGGFIDMGCGAGLLVHILTCEGYEGKGIDLRTRKSWSHYPTKTRERLCELPLDPLAPGFPSSDIFPPGVFLIGNHADELSPWLPVTTSLIDDAAYISIPCCPWSLDQKYIRSSNVFPQLGVTVDESLESKLGATVKSTYGSYTCWLSALSKECGFEGEYEALRIPSTRNWSIIGRRKLPNYDGKAKAQELLKMVIERGLFKARPGLCSNH